MELVDMADLQPWQLGWVIPFPPECRYPIIVSTFCGIGAIKPHLWQISNVWTGALPDRLL